MALFWGLLVVVASTDPAAADRRVALVIGNAAYQDKSLNLANPRNDAEDVASSLRGLGFEVLLAQDVDLSGANKAMQQFARLAAGADAALFFYAGHALQYQGRNFLMPVDAEVRDEIGLSYETIPLDNVRVALDQSSGVKIMVLDACRNNPVADRLARLSMPSPLSDNQRTRGLERVDRTQGLIVAYATGADETAIDGQGRNSPFTTAFLKRLNEPGLEIETMFRRIAYDVATATGGRQRPETYVSLVNEYYLNQSDRLAWERIKETDDPAVFRNFLARFPSSFYSLEARYKLGALDRALEEAKQRALREAEERLRRSEQAEREAAERASTQKACQANRAALNAIGPRDAAQLRAFLAAANCDEAKTIAQQRLTALEGQLAQEAETCRRDQAVLDGLGPRDAAGSRNLADRSACADVKTQARRRLAQIEDDMAKEAEACRRDGASINAAAGSRNLQALRDLEARNACPSVPETARARIAQIEATLAAEAETCRRDQAGLDGLKPRDLAGAREIGERSSCADVKNAARAKVAAIEADLAREAEVCRREDGELKTLLKQNDRAAVDALRGRAQCPATVAAADQGLRDLAVAADAVCARDNNALGAIGARDSEGLKTLLARNPCDAVRTSAQTRLRDLDSTLAREADVCRRDDEQWRGARNASRGEVETLRRSLECPATIASADQKLADMKAVCGRDGATLAKIGPRDVDALRAFSTNAGCDEAKTAAGERLAALQATLAHDADVCRRDDERLRAVAGGTRSEIETLRRGLECPAVVTALDQKLSELQVVCKRDGDAMGKLGAADVDAWRGFVARAACSEVRTIAQDRLGKLEAAVAQKEETCRTEDVRFASLKEKGAEARTELASFEQTLACDTLRPLVRASLEQMQPQKPQPEAVEPPKANTPPQIKAAQKELRRLGCGDVEENGSLDEDTDNTMREYLRKTGRGLKPTTPVRITDEVVARLEQEKGRLCTPPPAVAKPQPREEPRRAREEARRPPPEERRPAARREPPQRQPAQQARRAPEQRQPAPVNSASGGGGGGARGAAPSFGTGF